MAYSVDMMERYLLMRNQIKENKYLQNVLDEHTIILDVHGAKVELSNNLFNFQTNLGTIILSLGKNISEQPILRLDSLDISNRRYLNAHRNKILEESSSEYKFVNQKDHNSSEDSHDEVSF